MASRMDLQNQNQLNAQQLCGVQVLLILYAFCVCKLALARDPAARDGGGGWKHKTFNFVTKHVILQKINAMLNQILNKGEMPNVDQTTYGQDLHFLVSYYRYNFM